METLKRTPLYDAHVRRGARMVPFGGWEMPVQYSGISDEHRAVRSNAGIFDISHMGEIFVRGDDAEAFLNYSLTNDVRKLSPGEAQYTLMCNPRGGTVDDLYAYRLGPNEFLLIVNASRTDADCEWLQQCRGKYRVEIVDASSDYGAVAVQGPRVAEFIDECFAGDAKTSALKKNQFGRFAFDNAEVYVARTGYTGEDGFEVVASAQMIERVWEAILARGHKVCLQPCGLGARDTLRTEVCYPLYGHELDEETTPMEAGVGFFVALEKGDFIGRKVLTEQRAAGTTKRCVAFKMAEKSAPPRSGYPICGPGGEVIGQVTSGTQSPSLGVGIGLGYVPSAMAKPGTSLEIEVRGKRYSAEVVAKPIYRKQQSL